MRRKTQKQICAVDLFSGCGGLSLGLKRAGFSVLGAVEIDSRAIETYTANHPEVKVLRRDILDFSGKDLLHEFGLKKGELDLLAGCPPCQGFSRIRRLNKTIIPKDDRNDLVLQFKDLIAETLPKAVMLENVPGLEKDSRFAKLLGILRRHGYSFSWRILDVANYGVPQRRRRLVLLGCRGRKPRLNQIMSLPKCTVRQTIGSLEKPQDSKRFFHRQISIHIPRILSLIRLIPKDGGSRNALPKNFELKCHKEVAGFRDIYGRMAWDEVAPTITAGCVNPSKGRFLHPKENRAITIFEASLLQSFPRSYKFLPKYGRYPNAEMIGNALPPKFAENVSKYMARLIKD